MALAGSPPEPLAAFAPGGRLFSPVCDLSPQTSSGTPPDFSTNVTLIFLKPNPHIGITLSVRHKDRKRSRPARTEDKEEELVVKT